MRLRDAAGQLLTSVKSAADKEFKYSTSGSLLGSWTIDAANAQPTELTIDPSGASQDIWIVDSGTDRVYRYDAARSKTSGSQTAASSYALAAGNTNPQGIADPPTSASRLVPLLATGTPVAATSEMDFLGLLALDQLGRSGGSSSAPKPKRGPSLADVALLAMTSPVDLG